MNQKRLAIAEGLTRHIPYRAVPKRDLTMERPIPRSGNLTFMLFIHAVISVPEIRQILLGNAFSIVFHGKTYFIISDIFDENVYQLLSPE